MHSDFYKDFFNISAMHGTADRTHLVEYWVMCINSNIILLNICFFFKSANTVNKYVIPVLELQWRLQHQHQAQTFHVLFKCSVDCCNHTTQKMLLPSDMHYPQTHSGLPLYSLESLISLLGTPKRLSVKWLWRLRTKACLRRRSNSTSWLRSAVLFVIFASVCSVERFDFWLLSLSHGRTQIRCWSWWTGCWVQSSPRSAPLSPTRRG